MYTLLSYCNRCIDRSYFLHLGLLIIFWFGCGGGLIYAQDEGDIRFRSSSTPICINGDYRFKLNEEYIKNGKTAYLCEGNLPEIIEVVDKDTQTPIPYTTTWTGVAANPANTYSAMVTDTVFNSTNLKEIYCDFEDGQGPVTLSLKLFTKVELKYSQGKNAIFSFDPNEHPEYGLDANYNYNHNIPWKFLSPGVTDKVKVEIITGGRSANAVELQSNDPALTITPTRLPDKKEPIDLEYNGSTPGEAEVSGCSQDPELGVFSGAPFNIDVKFYFIDESDDDVTLVPPGTKMMDTTSVCVDVGMDGCLDLFRDKSWLQGDDKFAITRNGIHRLVVVAGVDSICSTSARPNNIKNNAIRSTSGMMNTANNIYAQLGITLSESSPAENTASNFDIYKDDNKLSLVERNELVTCFRKIVPIDPSLVNHVDVLVVNQFEKSYTALGKTTRRGFAEPNTLVVVLDGREGFSGSTLAHEIGHLLFGLEHPREEFTLTNPNDPSRSTEDRNNLMYWTQGDDMGNIIRIDNFRRYQYEQIFK